MGRQASIDSIGECGFRLVMISRLMTANRFPAAGSRAIRQLGLPLIGRSWILRSTVQFADCPEPGSRSELSMLRIEEQHRRLLPKRLSPGDKGCAIDHR